MERAVRRLLLVHQGRRRPSAAAASASVQALCRRHYHRLQQLHRLSGNGNGNGSLPGVQTAAAAAAATSQGRLQLHLLPPHMGLVRGSRRMSSKSGGEEAAAGAEQHGKKGEQQHEQGEDPDPEPEPQERIGLLRGLAYLTVFGLALGSLYFIVDELMPTRMSANHLFNEAFDAIKQNHEVLNRYGEPLKGYGRDAGGRREGRRNFVEHKNYVAEDGTKRLRIRFNIEGPFGHAFVFAEVTSDMPRGQWMYLLVQDLQTGRVLTVEDNRAMYDALGKAKSPGEREAIQALIQSGGGGK